MKKLYFVYNPNSGKGTICAHLDEILEVFEEYDYEVTIYRTKAPMDAYEQVKEKASDYDLVVCAGGDGTLSEVVSGVMTAEAEVPIGFIPIGSTNDTRISFQLPNSIREAAKVCVTGYEFQTDVGSFNDKHFVYVASLGSLSAVSCFTPQETKKIFGHGAYVIEGIKQLLKMESNYLVVEFDGNTIEGDFFLGMVSNSTSIGGFEGITGKEVDLQDGKFEVALLRKPANLLEFAKEVDMMLSNKQEKSPMLDDLVIRFKADKIKFSSEDDVQWVLDGEDGGVHKEVSIDINRKAVTIMTERNL